jgi:hypothetical protein
MVVRKQENYRTFVEIFYEYLLARLGKKSVVQVYTQ